MNEENNNYYYTNTNIPEQNDNKSKKSKFHDISSIRQLIVFLVGWIGLNLIALIYQIIAASICNAKGIIPEEGTDAYKVFSNNFSTWINFAAYATLAIIIVLIFNFSNMKRILKDFLVVSKIGKGVLYGLGLLAASIAYNYAISAFFPNIGSNQNQNDIVLMMKQNPFAIGFMTIIFAPFCEELTYRFSLFGLLNKKNKYLAFAVSTLVFGLIHSAFLKGGFSEMTQDELIVELVNLPSYFISGFILALAYYKEDSIATSMTAHLVNNLVAFISSMAYTGTMIYAIR